ncbi:CPBP family intramembrane glutamic endopeptidase [Streptococcus sp. DD12]|uniref:CPBP family intramembrane glutamic endopeptidase n=1 Tax=Streptococcus sp. DD12 TaxID=1777880 RepID=UPI0007950415|nr:type II CAAX endopeptidase family protein [Streptococcus sp. DD12]KXT75699.1 Membrane-bound protease, CAAX family [Streptococcus sp. DD12]
MTQIKKVAGKLGEALVICFADLALQLLLGIFLGYNAQMKKGFSPFQSWSYLLITLIAIFLLYQFALKRGFLTGYRKDRLHNKAYWLGFLSLYAWAILSSLLFSLIGQQSTNNQITVDSLVNQLPLLVTTSFVVISGPFCEELLCRQWLFSCLKKRPKLAIVLSALLFGGIHMASGFEPLSYLLYTGMGAILAFVYYKTNYSFKTVLWTHMSWNALSILTLVLSQS